LVSVAPWIVWEALKEMVVKLVIYLRPKDRNDNTPPKGALVQNISKAIS
jgi:hypothetical protein